MTPLQLPSSIGGYEILRTLAAGGMGAVLLGEKNTAQGFRKRVAIKVILPHLMGDAQAQAMFFDEARLAARFAHPNLVQVFDFGEDAGFFHIVMEFVDGVSVQKLIGADVAADVAAHIVLEAARGLAWAHALSDDGVGALGIVHRDISPDNLVVTTSGGTKVLDFGIARSRDRSAHSVSGLVRGKPPYMAPEQLRGEAVDGRADVWALGVVFFELLTGDRLFVGDGLPLIRRVLEEPLTPALTRICAPAPLGALVGRMLSRDPAARPTMAEVVTALEDSGHVSSSSAVLQAVGVPEMGIPASSDGSGGADDVVDDVVPRGEGDPTVKLHAQASGAELSPRPPTLPGAPAVVGPSPSDDEAAAVPRFHRSRAAALAFAVLGAGALGGVALKDDAVASVSSVDEGGVDIDDGAVAAEGVVERQDTSDHVERLAVAPTAIDEEPVLALDVSPKPRRKPPAAALTPRPSPSSPPPEPPATAASTATAGIVVPDRRPWVDVYVDGERVGLSPLGSRRQPFMIAAGSHHVRLVDPATGTAVMERTVELGPSDVLELR